VGWNLVSYLPEQTLPITEALQSIAGQYTAVLGFEEEALSYYPELPAAMNTLTVMRPGTGYWIWASEATTLVYPTHVESPPAEMENQGRRSVQNTLAFMSHPPWWVNFYGTAKDWDNLPLAPGTKILAINAYGEVCGTTVMSPDGTFGLLTCYVRNLTAAGNGETIRFMTDDGIYLGATKWTVFGELQELQLMKPILYLPLVIKD
jgi:hypothetical protein